MKLKDEVSKRLQGIEGNLQKFANLLVHHYWLKPAVKFFIKFKPNRIFDFINGWAQMGYKIKYATSFDEKCVYIKDLFNILARKG